MFRWVHLEKPTVTHLWNFYEIRNFIIVISVLKHKYSQVSVHERLGSWTIRFTNNFSEHKASRMTYCVSSYEYASRQHRGAISWEYQCFTSSPPSTYAVNSPPYRYGKTNLSFRLYLICLVLCSAFFFVIDLMVSIDFVLRTCAQSTVVKV